jgi:hypothetical protein
MSDAVNDVPAAPQPQPAPQSMSFDDLKQRLMQNFGSLYQQFVKGVSNIPANRLLVDRAMAHFDDGFLNFREAIATLQITAPQPQPVVAEGQQEPQPVAPSEQAEPAPAA